MLLKYLQPQNCFMFILFYDFYRKTYFNKVEISDKKKIKKT